MRVYYHTFGCKANQYDTERMRQEAEARGASTTEARPGADVFVVNTCTVTNQADADARKLIRRLHGDHPEARIVVAGCSAALKTQIELRASLDRIDTEPVGGELLSRRRGGARGWLKVQDGCDRKCSFCATRLARGASRSRPASEVVAEARLLARTHAELVVTGVHIGHYGVDLRPAESLSRLCARLLDEVPNARFRLGSIEATEVDDFLIDLLAGSDGRLAPHLHMPLQSGADAVLRRMRRWHTRGQYRRRALEIAERVAPLGMGADIITGFPGETVADHRTTVDLVAELPFTYLHVFPFSPRDGTGAAELPNPVAQRTAGERARELRSLAEGKGRAHRAARVGTVAQVVLEGTGSTGLTGDYLRVDATPGTPGSRRLVQGVLRGDGDHLRIDASYEMCPN